MKSDIAFIYCCVQSIRAKTMPHNATALQFKAFHSFLIIFDSVPFRKNVMIPKGTSLIHVIGYRFSTHSIKTHVTFLYIQIGG